MIHISFLLTFQDENVGDEVPTIHFSQGYPCPCTRRRSWLRKLLQATIPALKAFRSQI